MKLAARWAAPVSLAMSEFGISTPERQAAFLAQIGHESDGFATAQEYASGAAYDTGAKAIALGNTPEADGDGQRYKGRGLIQITGHRNYVLCGMALELDLLEHPELLLEPINAARSAGWYWKNSGCNALADRGDFVGLTRVINGGTNGLADRQSRWKQAKAALGV
ncbi:glycoside hydrolase family 19 protein [Pandoraea pneumonica]|uniref:glycoside hydrolase family 19 protein n=1 Tax=Pandoraea pneumonica TaxID=2508299 RepID=UPI001FECF8A5|nr:glycoside hydrolase family 19 protein [Pandoraea pneumonica]